MSKQKSHKTSYSEEYAKDFPFITKSTKGPHFAFCKICRRDINISHAGRKDISLHATRQVHKDNERLENASKNTPKINQLMAKQDDMDVINAEVLFANFMVEHNFALAAADHTGNLFRKMFPDSAIAKKYSSGRTKTTHLVQTLAEDAQSAMVKALKSGPFSLATDGGNDKAVVMTLYPLVVSYFCQTHQEIRTSLLSVPSLEVAGTGKNIAELVIVELGKLGVDEDTFRKNCVAIATDNAAVMIGTKDGMLGQLRQKSPSLFSVGCACHLINLAAQKAADALPVRIDEVLIDLFYYLEKSKKRKQALRQFQDEDAQKILKHVSTRWLSLGQCLGRLISNWPALINFFEEEVKAKQPQKPASAKLMSFTIPKKRAADDDGDLLKPPAKKPSLELVEEKGSSLKKNTPKKDKGSAVKKSATDISVGLGKGSSGSAAADKKSARHTEKKDLKPSEGRQERLYSAFLNTQNLCFASFLKSVVPVFEKVNKLLQAEKPLVHKLQATLLGLFTALMNNFVQVSVLKDKDPFTVNFTDEKVQKADDQLFVGAATESLLDTVSASDRQVFYSSVRRYYVAACKYILEKFPVRPVGREEMPNHYRSDLLQHVQVADIAKVADHSWSDLSFFIKHFPSLVLRKLEEDLAAATDQLQLQWQDFQQYTVPKSIADEEREDIKWAKLSLLKEIGGASRFDRLAYFMLGLLTIPHSNAACERLFSQVRKNKTDFRGSLASDTLNAMLVVKGSMKGVCYEQNYSQDLLRKAKSATAQALRETAN